MRHTQLLPLPLRIHSRTTQLQMPGERSGWTWAWGDPWHLVKDSITCFNQYTGRTRDNLSAKVLRYIHTQRKWRRRHKRYSFKEKKKPNKRNVLIKLLVMIDCDVLFVSWVLIRELHNCPYPFFKNIHIPVALCTHSKNYYYSRHSLITVDILFKVGWKKSGDSFHGL